MRHICVVILLGLVWSMGCRPAPAGSAPPAVDIVVERPNLSVDAAPGAATESEIRRVRDLAERAYTRYAQVLGPDRMPSRTIAIRLAGDAADGQVSTVSPESGAIVLYRHPGPGGGYESSLAHELMHAVRWDIWKQANLRTEPFLFLEEGLAELMAIEAGLPSTGFPTYGHDIVLAAGTWIASDLDLPISELVTRHSQLNFRCMPQAYTLRLSFLLFVRERVGLDALVDVAFDPRPLSLARLEATLGAPIEAVARTWRGHALRQFAGLNGREQRRRDYLEGTPVRYFTVCDPNNTDGSAPSGITTAGLTRDREVSVQGLGRKPTPARPAWTRSRPRPRRPGTPAAYRQGRTAAPFVAGDRVGVAARGASIAPRYCADRVRGVDRNPRRRGRHQDIIDIPPDRVEVAVGVAGRG